MVSACVKSSKGFYVGDICYALPDSVYDGVWGAKGYEDGEYEVNGHSFAVAGTAYGDGTYHDTAWREYDVDAGVIGVVPLELVDESKDLSGGQVFMFDGYCGLESEDGVFDISFEKGGTIHIDTGDDEDEEDEEYDYDDDNYDEYNDEDEPYDISRIDEW